MKYRLGKIYTYLAALICLSIPFMTYAKAFVNIIMICLFLILILTLKKDKITGLFNPHYLKIFFGFLIFVILFSLFNQSFFDDFSETRKIAQTLLLLIVFSQVKNKNIFQDKLTIELETYDLQGLTQFLLLTESEITQMSESEKNKLLELINE